MVRCFVIMIIQLSASRADRLSNRRGAPTSHTITSKHCQTVHSKCTKPIEVSSSNTFCPSTTRILSRVVLHGRLAGESRARSLFTGKHLPREQRRKTRHFCHDFGTLSSAKAHVYVFERPRPRLGVASCSIMHSPAPLSVFSR